MNSTNNYLEMMMEVTELEIALHITNLMEFISQATNMHTECEIQKRPRSVPNLAVYMIILFLTTLTLVYCLL